MSRSIYIYALCEPDTEAVRYVGKSVNPRRRLYQHVSERAKTHKAFWIRSLADRGRRPLLRVLEEVSEDDCSRREMYWIEHFRLSGSDLTNLTDGGDGASTDRARTHLSAVRRGVRFSQEHRAALRLAWERRRERGVSEETRSKLSRAGKGRVFTEEHRRKLSLSLSRPRGPLPPETRLKLSMALKGRPKPAEVRKNMSEAARRRKTPPLSDETKAKLSEAMRRVHAERRAARAAGERSAAQGEPSVQPLRADEGDIA